jgi:pyruvate-ferredoxin/flavodoxin oxidoreductase
MENRRIMTIDGNEAVASVAYRTNEVIAIYPITPASPMGELSDEWSAQKRTNIWDAIPQVVEMQSEGGAASKERSPGSCEASRRDEARLVHLM